MSTTSETHQEMADAAVAFPHHDSCQWALEPRVIHDRRRLSTASITPGQSNGWNMTLEISEITYIYIYMYLHLYVDII